MNAVKAVIFDWAGTVLDHGSRALMDAFVAAFAKFGVAISVADARGPMGMAKRDHIRLVGMAPAVGAAWRTRHGRPFAEADIDAVLALFEPMNAAAVEAHSALVPGAREALAWCKARGLRIGSTTGYTRPIMDRLAPLAAAQGFRPEIVVCAGDLPAGRPSPVQMWHAMAALGVWPAGAVMKIDDTAPGMGEARASGTWPIGVAMTGNSVGLSAEELAALPAAERAALRVRATRELLAAGAHMVIDSVACLPDAAGEIERRMAAGDQPGILDID